jgi:hypothetical protein
MCRATARQAESCDPPGGHPAPQSLNGDHAAAASDTNRGSTHLCVRGHSTRAADCCQWAVLRLREAHGEAADATAALHALTLTGLPALALGAMPGALSVVPVRPTQRRLQGRSGPPRDAARDTAALHSASRTCPRSLYASRASRGKPCWRDLEPAVPHRPRCLGGTAASRCWRVGASWNPPDSSTLCRAAAGRGYRHSGP